ncbi:MAG: Ig-like domain-containing protein [Patescibacteria group bacterium]
MNMHLPSALIMRALSLVIALGLVGAPMSTFAATKTTVSIDSSSLSTTDTTPKISGKATDKRSVRVEIKDDDGDRVFRSKDIKVKNGRWNVTAPKALARGSYKVTVTDTKSSRTKASGTLSIKRQAAATTVTTTTTTVVTNSPGALSVSSLPLLAGGTAAQGASVPVAYLKVENPSSAAIALEGFTLKQNGTASGANVIGFTTSDDKGGSRTQVGGAEASKQFKNGLAYVPLAATILPGQVRIFTIKALMSKNAGTDLGKYLFIDVTGVKAKGSVRATYPIRGAMWTLVR